MYYNIPVSWSGIVSEGTAAAVPPPFIYGEPALCGSRPLSPHISVD